MTKVEDSFREKVIVEEGQSFVQLVKNCLLELNELKESVMNLSHQYFQGARDFCISQLSFAVENLRHLETNQEEVDNLANETEGLQTDRSLRSLPDEEKKEEL